MIVAGIGCRKGVAAAEIAAAIRETLDEIGAPIASLGLVATGETKRNELGIVQAATMLGVPLLVLDDNRLQGVAGRCITISGASLETAGVPSLSEASALVAAGRGGRLLGPRSIHGGVTCALGVTVTADAEPDA